MDEERGCPRMEEEEEEVEEEMMDEERGCPRMEEEVEEEEEEEMDEERGCPRVEEEEEEEMGWGCPGVKEGGGGKRPTYNYIYPTPLPGNQHTCVSMATVKASSLSFAVVWSGSKVRTSL